MAHRHGKSQGRLRHANQTQDEENKDDDISVSSDETSPPRDDQGSSTNESDTHSKGGSHRTGSTMDDEAIIIKEELARVETKNVFRLRIVVIVIMVTVAMTMAFTMYYITRKAEIEAFEIEYEGVADSIISSLNGTCKGIKAVWSISRRFMP